MHVFRHNWGWGRERCPSSKKAQTRFETFDWGSENEH
jgi:hypothetical protein